MVQEQAKAILWLNLYYSTIGRVITTDGMSSIPQEIIIAGILAAFAAHPDLIPPALLPHNDSDPNDIHLLRGVQVVTHGQNASDASKVKTKKRTLSSKNGRVNTCSPLLRMPSMR